MVRRIALFLWICAAIPCAAFAQDELYKREKFTHEQCANACHITLDKDSNECNPFREDGLKVKPESCELDAFIANEKCVAACPPRPPPRQQ